MGAYHFTMNNAELETNLTPADRILYDSMQPRFRD